jgi:hypothetical protein
VRYRVAGDTLTLVRGRDGVTVGQLERSPTYCLVASDCADQDYARPRCIGEDACDATHTCAWQCGRSDATCNDHRCVDGERCEVVAGEPRCVSKDSTCNVALCPPDRPHCVAAGGELACLPPDACHRDADCPDGTSCQPEFICVRAPCFAPLVCR